MSINLIAMLITSSVIELKQGGFSQIKSYLGELPGVEVRGVSKDMSRVLLIIETTDTDTLEKISEKINKHPSVLSFLHHSFHFDESE